MTSHGLRAMQVLDVDRHSKFKVDRIDDGFLPHRHLETLTSLHHRCSQSKVPIHIIICSHVERSEKNLQALLDCAERSRLPVSLILVTVERTGVQGKFAAIRDAVKGQFCLFDDN